MKKLVALLLLLSMTGLANAGPVAVIVGQLLVATGTYVAIGWVLVIGGAIAMTAEARRKARKAEAEAIRAWNDSLEDRSITTLTGNPPLRIIYGNPVTNGDIVAILQSNKVSPAKNFSGESKVKKNGLKHIVIRISDHELTSIDDIYIDGKSVLPLDVNGWSLKTDVRDANGKITEAGFANPKEVTLLAVFATSVTLTEQVTEILSAVQSSGSGDGYSETDVRPSITLSNGNLTINSAIAGEVKVSYTVTRSNSVIKFDTFLGAPGQTVNPYLNSVLPTEWDSTHKMENMGGVVMTLDMEDQRFQGGPPQVTFKVKGRKIYDPRKDTTNGGSGSHRLNNSATWEYSSNVALVERDWLQQKWGYGVDPTIDIDNSYTIDSANVCDEPITLLIDGTSTPNQPRYTCHAVITTDKPKESVFEDLDRSMAGMTSYGAKWRIIAGKWTTPSMTIGNDDLHGEIEIVQVEAGMDEIFNCVRGTYYEADTASPKDYTPFKQQALIDADGLELWENKNYPFTDNVYRCSNLARIETEKARASLVVRIPAKLRARPLTVGERIWVNNSEYGFVSKTFRVVDTQFSPETPVILTAQEDYSTVWDGVDNVNRLLAPNSNLPDPNSVDALSGLTAVSGTQHLQRAPDGKIITRVYVSWGESDDPYVEDGTGKIYLRWRYAGSGVWNHEELPGDSIDAYISGLRDGFQIIIGVMARNGLGRFGPEKFISHLVVGKETNPSNVASLSYTIEKFDIKLTWPGVSDADLRRYELRTGTNWDSAVVIGRPTATNFSWSVQSSGTYKVLVKALDTTGHYSTSAASVDVVVGTASAPGNLQVSVSGPDYVLTWSAVNASYSLDTYEVKADGVVVTRVKALTLRKRIDWLGVKTFTVAAVDAADIVGSTSSVDLNISAPGQVTSLRAEVIDNNVLLYWNVPSTGSLPVEYYEVRRGASWAGGVIIGSNGNSTFTPVFEQQSGDYTYRVRAYDSAGNEGPEKTVPARVSEPPDYVLRANIVSTFANQTSGSVTTTVTLTNMVRESDGAGGWDLIGPFNTSETWGSHFSSRGWSTVQDQITAGYDLYLQPSTTSGSYEEVLDYGSVIPATTINSVLLSTLVDGSVTASCQLSFKRVLTLSGTTGWTNGSPNVSGSSSLFTTQIVAGDKLIAPNGSTVTVQSVTSNTALILTTNYGGTTLSGQTTNTAWNDTTAGATQGLFSDFRYVRVLWTFTCTAGGNTTRVDSSTIKLSVKLRTDSGYGTANSGDSGGTTVNFNTAFIDVSSINVTPKETTARYAVYDFTDVPNPTSFKVLLFNNSGTRVSGDFSWTARGI